MSDKNVKKDKNKKGTDKKGYAAKKRFTENKKKIIKALMNGVSVVQICKDTRISSYSFYKWMEEDSELKEELKSAQSFANISVEDALYKSALGYFITTEKVTKDGDVVKYEAYIAPSMVAQIFYLKNRMPDRWKDRTEVDGNIKLNGGLSIFELMQKEDESENTDKTKPE